MRVKGYPAGILYEYTVYVLQQHIQHVYVWGVGGRGRMCASRAGCVRARSDSGVGAGERLLKSGLSFTA